MATFVFKRPDEWKDVVLFSHVIPICQHYKEGYKIEFEEAIEARRSTFGDWNVFRDYLLTHPRNQGMLKAFIRSRREQDIKETDDTPGPDNIESVQVPQLTRNRGCVGASIAQAALNDVRLTRERARSGELKLLDSVITWENVLCLMRNIVCHEEDTRWRALAALAQHAIQFFGSRAAVADMLCSYYRLVVVAKQLPGHNTQLIDHYNMNPDVEPYEPVWDAILLYSPFIIYRSLNALIDDRLEDELHAMAVERQFGSWEMLTMYLQMHPANPEQTFLARDKITWMMIIRMARNVFCHEQYINWTLLKEFDDIFLHYFGTRQNILDVFDVIHRHCFVQPMLRDRCQTVNHQLVRHNEAPRIQYHEPDNICMVQCCGNHSAKPTVGLMHVQSLVDKLTRKKFKSVPKIVLIAGHERIKLLSLVASYLNEIEVAYNVVDEEIDNLFDHSLSNNAVALVLTSMAGVLKLVMEREQEKTKAVKSSVVLKQLHSDNTKLFSSACVRDMERLARHLSGVSKHDFRAFNIDYPFIHLPALTLSDALLDTTTPLHHVISVHTRSILRTANEELAQLKRHALDVELLPYISGSLVLNRAVKHLTEQSGRCHYLQDQFLTLLLMLDVLGGSALRAQWLDTLMNADDTQHLDLLNDIMICLPLCSCTKDRFNANIEGLINDMIEDTLLTPDPTVNYARVLFDECALKIRTAATWQSVTTFNAFVELCLRTFKYRTLFSRILMTIKEEF